MKKNQGQGQRSRPRSPAILNHANHFFSKTFDAKLTKLCEQMALMALQNRLDFENHPNDHSGSTAGQTLTFKMTLKLKLTYHSV